MSLRSRAAAPTANGEGDHEQKARLDRVLRAGLVDQERMNGSAPTGVLGFLRTLLNKEPLIPSAPQREPSFPTGPRFYSGSDGATQPPGGEGFYSSAIKQGNLKDESITVPFGGRVMQGTYTGETVKGEPYGKGEFVVKGLYPTPLDKYGELQSHVQELMLNLNVDKEKVRAAREAVETEAAIPTEAYDAAWNDIKSFARAQKKDSGDTDDTDVTLKLLVEWGMKNPHQFDLFGAHAGMSRDDFRAGYMIPMVKAGDELGGPISDGVLSTVEFKKYVAALRHGDVDITPDRRREPTAAEAMKIGQQVLRGDFEDGAFVGGLDTFVSTVSTEEGSTKHTVQIKRRNPGLGIDKVTYEMRQDGWMTQWVVLGRADDIDPTLYRGNVEVLTRNRVHRFAWSGPAERVHMLDGTARVLKGISALSADRIVLNGIAKVCVTVAETEEQIWLSGEMVNDRLRGKVTADVPMPGIDGLVFYVDGYDKHGVPIVRMPDNSPRSPSPPPTSRRLLSSPPSPPYSPYSPAFEAWKKQQAALKRERRRNLPHDHRKAHAWRQHRRGVRSHGDELGSNGDDSFFDVLVEGVVDDLFDALAEWSFTRPPPDAEFKAHTQCMMIGVATALSLLYVHNQRHAPPRPTHWIRVTNNP